MKKLSILLLIFALCLNLASCKKDVKETDTENSVSETQTQPEEAPKENESAPKEAQNEQESEKAPTKSSGAPVSASEFENLVDTFNSTDNEAKREEARKQIEDILKEIEKNQ